MGETPQDNMFSTFMNLKLHVCMLIYSTLSAMVLRGYKVAFLCHCSLLVCDGPVDMKI